MKPKKLLSLMLAVLIALSLVSCNSGSADGSDKEYSGDNSEESVVYNLASIRENVAGYTIVRSDTSSKAVTDAAVLLRKTVNSAAGADVQLTTDWDDGDYSGRREILVGMTNRESSIKAHDALAEGKYSITEDENGNIILAGYDDGDVVKCVEIFLTQYFGYEPEEVKNMLVHNVKDYGAVGDEKTDDTNAFREAVKAAEADGLPVYVPGGKYIISDTIELNSVTLYGYETGAWTADNCDQPMIKQTNMLSPLFNVKSGSVSGLNLDCNGDAKLEGMQPTILITGTGGRVSNMRIHHPYIGIYTDDDSNPGRCFIENIFIVEAKEMGVYVAGTYDVPALNNIEVWNPSETCPIAFKFGHNDDLRAVNLFAFNANVGFAIEKTETGSCWGSFTNCSVDYTSIGFRIGEGEHHVTIVGGTYWTHHMAINVTEKCTGYVAASGCELKSNGEKTLNIQGGRTVTISGSTILHDFETDFPAISVSGGMAVNISGNTIYSRPTAIELTSRKKDTVIAITNNVIYTGGEEIKDTSKNCITKIDNTVITGMDFSK